jgi:hypothetical protein
MGTIEQKNLDWIERAPVSFSGSATTTASPEAVFAILADHEHWPEWFPVLTKEEVVGPRPEGIGTRRLATIPGGKVEEVIIAWDPGQRFAFAVTAVSARPPRRLPHRTCPRRHPCHLHHVPRAGGGVRPAYESDEGADGKATRQGHAGPRRPRRGALNGCVGFLMFASGTKRTSGNFRPMSACGGEADIPPQGRDFCL